MSTTKKIVVLIGCDACPFFDRMDHYYAAHPRCELSQKPIYTENDNFSIPDSCPLPDATKVYRFPEEKK